MASSHAIWTEKYRPQMFSDVRGQAEIVTRLRSLVDSKNVPHLLFSGPAGIGKTTLALIIAKELFGESWRQNFLELNASDARGIDVIRNEVKDFSRTKSVMDAPFKIIFLDESDALTREAQQALRRTMETYSGSCRFILSCNYPSKLIDPIKSRCTLFKFTPLKDDALLELLEQISASESLTVASDAKDLLVKFSQGDVRKLTNLLQSCAAASPNVSSDTVYKIVSQVQPKDVLAMLQSSVAGDFSGARKQLVDIIYSQGLSGLDIIKQIQKEVWSLDLPDEKKLRLVERCGDIEFRLVEGSDDLVQLEAFLAFCACK